MAWSLSRVEVIRNFVISSVALSAIDSENKIANYKLSVTTLQSFKSSNFEYGLIDLACRAEVKRAEHVCAFTVIDAAVSHQFAAMHQEQTIRHCCRFREVVSRY